VTPQRIQLRRTKGWRKPEGAIVVSRPSRWGNPYVVHHHTDACYDEGSAAELACPGTEGRETRSAAVKAFEHIFRFPLSYDPDYPDVEEIRGELAGHDLACWCPLDQPCHADVLLELANR
jgi:hypothetical protein